MATNRNTQHDPAYMVEEPTTGLYAAFAGDTASLTFQYRATRFTTANDARLAVVAAGIADQPHEICRVSP